MNTAVSPAQPLYDAVQAAITARNTAEQAVNDAFTAMRVSPNWGKIQKLNWDYEYESDDQGGTYVCVHGLALTIDGERYHLGGCEMGDWDETESENEDKPAFDAAYKKAQLVVGGGDKHKLLCFTFADLADIDEPTFEHFMWLAQEAMDDEKTAGEVTFGF